MCALTHCKLTVGMGFIFMRTKRKVLLLKIIMIFLALVVSNCAVCQQIANYPRPESSNDVRSVYPLALLELCEEKSKGKVKFQPSSVHTQQARSIRQLVNGTGGMDVMWGLTNDERENTMLPIRIPIDRGLIGWRLMLIRDQDRARFAAVSTKDDLAKLVAGQGHDWPDVDVLRANQLRVTTSSTYQGLFHMLVRGHIDYFPRSISEIWPEAEAHRNVNLSVQSHLLVHYPAALYYFVNKNNTELARTIEACLNTAIADGSLQNLFNQYYADAISQARLSERTIIRLTNPSLPKATPLANSAYWFSPTEIH